MNPRDAGHRERSPQEMVTALEWLDAELAPEAAWEFELRLASDPELARDVEVLAGMDQALRREARARARTERTRRRWNVGVLLAAAALLAVTLLPQLFETRAPDFEVALAPGYALAEDWARAQPELVGASAPGIATARGVAAPQLGAGEFLRASELAEVAVARNALEAQRRDLAAGYFVVPLELDAAASVVILALPASGAATRLFPEVGDPERASAAVHLGAGRHVLPSARAVAGSEPTTLAYRPGFLVPIGSVALDVLVAVHRGPLDGEALAQIDRWLVAAATREELASHLRREGFTTKLLRVREP